MFIHIFLLFMKKELIEKELLKKRLQKMNENKLSFPFDISERELNLTLEMAINKTFRDNGLLE